MTPKSGLDGLSTRIEKMEEWLQERYPNLKSEEYLTFLYIFIGQMIGRGFYVGLEFPRTDHMHIEEIKALSNGYVEENGSMVKMGVIKLENFERLLQAPYITHNTVHIFEY